MTKKDNHNDGELDLAAKLKKAQEEASSRESEDLEVEEATAKESKKANPEAFTNETEQLRTELDQMTELAKRTMADLKNLNRHREEERRFLITMGNAELIKQLLPVLDNLDRAREHVPQGAEEWFKGLEMSIDQMHKVFNDAGLTPMECVGESFDPDLHEAMLTGPGNKDEILEELEKGYMLGDRVVRHAKVKVGNGEKE